MITPAPTSPIANTLARGLFEGFLEASTLVSAGFNSASASQAPSPRLKMSFIGTSYELHLIPKGPIQAKVGKRLVGIIRALARRIDIVQTGGRYIEPVMGRPRRIQGSIVAIGPSTNSIVVDASVPIHCECTDPQRPATSFQVGQFVSFDVIDGATFTQAQA
jgi:hypothetical protein